MTSGLLEKVRTIALEQPGDRLWFVPPYVGTRGWIGMRLADDTDWRVVEDVLSDAWETVAKPGQRARLLP